MDANGQRFFLLADAADFGVEAQNVAYDTGKRRLKLASTRTGPAPRSVDEATARKLVERVPGAIDAFGSYAWWSAGAKQIVAEGALEEPASHDDPGATRSDPRAIHPETGQLDPAPTDVCLGDDGVVAIAWQGAVTLLDVRGHFRPTPVPMPAPLTKLAVWRIAAAGSFGFVALDRTRGELAHLTGAPAADPAPRERSAGVFRPCRENPDPPVWEALPAIAWDPNEEAVALAMAPDGAVVVLSWAPSGDARLRVLPHGAAAWGGPCRVTSGLPHGTGEPAPATWAMSIAFVGADRLAVLVPGLFVPPGAPAAPGVSEALVFAWPLASRAREGAPPDLLPLGDFYPLTDAGTATPGPEGLGPRLGTLTLDRAEPLFRGPTGESAYATSGGPRMLSPLSRKATPRHGEVRARVLDSHAANTAWHRLYLEAVIPDGTGVRVWLAATNDTVLRDDVPFFPHDFGHVPNAAPGIGERDVPRGAFVRARSEIPFEKGFLGCDPEAPSKGLFTALVQRAGRAVRTLVGRRLHVRIEMFGTGTASPEIAAVRIYSPRFSYVDKYLPELYAETALGPDGDATDRATGSDFLGRLLAITESELTPMEDRVAAAYLLSDPRKTPDEALDWLASWVGLALDPAFSAEKRRALLRVAPALARRHGTLEGLKMALDAITSGGAQSGKIVIVEDYRMRRVFATILGAHLEEDDDPLLPGGLIASGNSYVGDTLFLGEETHETLVELAALYRATPSEEAAEEALGADHADPLDGFYESFAHRVTVLVHEKFSAQELDWIDRAVALETPAHVEARVVKARWPFLVGIASLVGVDSFLRPPIGLEAFRLDDSALGVKDVISRPPSLDPRLESSSAKETP